MSEILMPTLSRQCRGMDSLSLAVAFFCNESGLRLKGTACKESHESSPRDLPQGCRRRGVEELLEFLRRHQIPTGAGIALRITQHTPASCLLILAILNHNCYFFATDKMLLSEALHAQMCAAGVDYLLVSEHLAVGALYFQRLDSILVLNEECKLFKLKRTKKSPKVQAKKPLPANMCYTITTTGTTGSPKLIHVPYECIAPNIESLSQKLNVSMADIIYLGTPCTFDPFVVEIFLAIQNGAALLISHHSMRDSPSRVLNALFPFNLTKPGISLLQMTPSLFRQFGSTVIRERVLSSSSSLRVLLLGAKPFCRPRGRRFG